MSILASLVAIHDRLAKQNLVPPFGYATQNIHGCLVIDSGGSLVGAPVIFATDQKGKISARLEDVPFPGGRSGSNAPPYFLWDNTAYILGVSAKENFDASKRFDSFRQYHLDAIASSTDEGLRAVFSFIRSWKPESFEEAGFNDEMRDKNFVFRLSSEPNFIHQRPAAVTLWHKLFEPDTIGDGVCLVSGSRSKIARIHPPIGSFENPARIVSFDKDNDAFSSYGHTQAENAPTGIEVSFAYTAVLNRFLRRNSANRVQIGDASTVFWADSSNAEAAQDAESLFAQFVDPKSADTTDSKRVGIILERMRKGEMLHSFAPDLDKGVRFFVLGLAPNAARLSIRYYTVNPRQSEKPFAIR